MPAEAALEGVRKRCMEETEVSVDEGKRPLALVEKREIPYFSRREGER